MDLQVACISETAQAQDRNRFASRLVMVRELHVTFELWKPGGRIHQFLKYLIIMLITYPAKQTRSDHKKRQKHVDL